MVILAALRFYNDSLRDLKYDKIYAAADIEGQAYLDNQVCEISNIIQHIQHKIFFEDK